jgi:hypothetical protein
MNPLLSGIAEKWRVETSVPLQLAPVALIVLIFLIFVLVVVICCYLLLLTRDNGCCIAVVAAVQRVVVWSGSGDSGDGGGGGGVGGSQWHLFVELNQHVTYQVMWFMLCMCCGWDHEPAYFNPDFYILIMLL